MPTDKKNATISKLTDHELADLLVEFNKKASQVKNEIHKRAAKELQEVVKRRMRKVKNSTLTFMHLPSVHKGTPTRKLNIYKFSVPNVPTMSSSFYAIKRDGKIYIGECQWSRDVWITLDTFCKKWAPTYSADKKFWATT
jgi:hypothetical protein